MPSVAEVQFKATGQQTVVSAFKSVGDSASTATTKVQQNSGAMKTMGQGMKSSVSGIASAASAFATLSLSVVNTWRAYRDLSDAQIAVDKANLRVKKTTEAIRKTEQEIAAIKKEGAKGGLEDARRKIDLTKLTQALAAAQKKYGKNSLQAADAALSLKEAQAQGSGSSKKLTDAQNKLVLQQEQLGVQTDVANEAQERFNDTQQNFYLSILPTALSGFASLSMAFSGMKGMFSGGGGLIGMFGPIGLAIAGVSLAIIAFQTNFLGLRDAIGGVITWFKDRFGVWKDTIQEVFGFIQKGDWAGAFNRIKEAAAAFWADLVKTVPLFGHIAEFITAIKGGNWKGAFLMIAKGATDAWATIKKNVPILGAVEDVVNLIKAGKWSEAFQTIADAAKKVFTDTLGKGIEFFFGKEWISKLQAAIALFIAEANQKGGGLTGYVVQVGITLNATIKAVTGIDVEQWFKDHPITLSTLSLPLGGITISIEDPTFQAGLKKGSEIILNALGAALSAGAKILDPYLAKAVAALNWNTAITSVRDAILNAGQAIWDTIFQGIQGGFGNQDWGKLFTDFGKTVNDAWKNNLPQLQKALVDQFQGSVGAKILGAAGIKFQVTPEVDKNTPTIIQNGISARGKGGYKVPLGTNPAKLNSDLAKLHVDIGKKPPAKLPIGANLADANAKWHAFMKKVASTKVNIPVGVAGGSSNIKIGSQAGAYGGPHAAGWNTTVKRPTMFMAGEGGRQEDVYIKPRGSAGQGPSGGGFNGTINVFVDGVAQKARYEINKFQGVMK